jgi:hypothetical protein
MSMVSATSIGVCSRNIGAVTEYKNKAENADSEFYDIQNKKAYAKRTPYRLDYGYIKAREEVPPGFLRTATVAFFARL